MPQDYCLRHAEPMERAGDQFSLCCLGPDNIPRSICMAKAGTIENDDAMIL
jgi:hypothetical protein